MKLQAVTVCVNYADFFEQTGEANRGIFDKFVVVTDCKDTEVTALCERFGYECLKTDAFYENGATFNKYAGINEGLKLIDEDAWVVFIDSDIVLQKDTRRVLECLDLDMHSLYGIDRVNCTSFEAWEKYKAGKGVLMENWMLTSAGLELGARLVHYYGHHGENGRFEGWRPLGFFQLCHKSTFNWYPQETNGADHCDLVFARCWKRRRRHFIPELLAVHLESESGNGVNWYGRKSAPFVPSEKDLTSTEADEYLCKKIESEHWYTDPSTPEPNDLVSWTAGEICIAVGLITFLTVGLFCKYFGMF